MIQKVNILGFAGSLRKGSYNKALLRATSGLVPENANLEIFDLEGIPPYNQDLEASMPEKVKEFKQKIRAADAILMVTPEYNHSVSSVLSNALAWGTRPHGDNSFENKPVAIMSASTGMLGGARAQYHLRQMFVYLNMFPINKPQVFVNFADQKFDEQGNFTDEKGKTLIRELLEELVAWTNRIKANRT